MLTQEEMKTLFLPILKERGTLYQKVLPVLAREVKKKEKIQTHTSDGLETENVAEKGDFIVQNQTNAKEHYVMSAQKFKDRYVFMEATGNGMARYKPIGKIWAIEMTQVLSQQLDLSLPFHFLASWGSSMVVKEKDFLACGTDFSSVYRIARKEFFETYELL